MCDMFCDIHGKVREQIRKDNSLSFPCGVPGNQTLSSLVASVFTY